MLIRHSVLYTTAKFLPGIVGIATTGFLTHLFDPAQFGVYGLIIVIMTLISNVGFDWLGVSFLRFYEANKDDPRTLATFAHIYALTTLACLIIVFPLLVLGSFKELSVPICMLGIILALSYSAFEIISKFEIANFHPVRYLMMNLARGILIFVGAVGGGWLTGDPIWAAAGTGAGMLVSVGFGTLRFPHVGFQYFNRDLARRVLRFGIPLAVSMTFAALITGVTRLLIDALNSRESLGLYTAAFVLVQNSLTVLSAGISSISYQLAVRAVESGNVALERRQLLSNGTMLLAVLAPASIGMILTANDIATTLVGPKFQAPVAALTPWLTIAGFFASLRAYFFDYSFQLGARPNAQAWLTAVAAIAAIALSVYLIPTYGPLGAAIAVTVAMTTSCLLAATVGRYVYYIPFPFRSAIQIAICCTVMALAVLTVPGNGPFSLAGKVMLGSLVYTIAAVSFNILDSRVHLSKLLQRINR